MAIGSTVTLTGTAQNLNPTGLTGTTGNQLDILIKNPASGSNAHLGGPDVTSSGFLLEAGESVNITIVNGTIWAIGSDDVYVLIS